jgi:hypothetical protein
MGRGWYGEREPKPIYCYDKHDHERVFYYHVQDNGFPSAYDFSLFVVDQPVWPPKNGCFYEISIKRDEKGELQTINMDNHGHDEYKGRGITEAILPEISRLVGEDIVSSPAYQDNANRRSISATVVWERLVESRLAVPEADRFRLLKSATAQAARRRERVDDRDSGTFRGATYSR